jgi:seryl-tRNA synthetase
VLTYLLKLTHDMEQMKKSMTSLKRSLAANSNAATDATEDVPPVPEIQLPVKTIDEMVALEHWLRNAEKMRQMVRLRRLYVVRHENINSTVIKS